MTEVHATGTAGLLLDGDTLGESLRAVACAAPQASVTFPGLAASMSNASLLNRAEQCARLLVADGVRRGDIVGLVAPPGPGLLAGLFGCWLAGAAVTVLPTQSGFSSTEGQLSRISRMMDTAGMRHLIAGDLGDDMVGRLVQCRTGLRVVPALVADAPFVALPHGDPGDLAVVQFTSGTVTEPRGVLLSHRAVLAGLRAIAVSARHTPDEVIVQWMPHYHDMGLFGHLSVLLNGGNSHVLAPMALLRRPAQLLRYLATSRATIFTGMNFAYEILIDAASGDVLDGLDLSAWRLAYNGAEPVSPDTVRRFQETFAVAGVAASVMYPVYGLAEATLAVTFPVPGSLPAMVTVDRAELGRSGRVRLADPGQPDAKTVVSVGRPVAGLAVRLAGDRGLPLGPGQLGELQVRGEMVTSGYLGSSRGSAGLFDGDWLRTGDLAFQLDGEYYVMGRRKEMTIVNGQNYFPEDAEAVARVVPGVYRRRAGDTAQAGLAGEEYIAVIAETTLPDPSRDGLAREIRQRVVTELGTANIQVHLVPPRWLTRTTSGKWQRLLALQRISEVNGL
jgi:fatty-acyl-CoA synthase